MAISSKIKVLLKRKGKENAEFARHLGISTQVLSNKFYQDCFSASDLIRIAAPVELHRTKTAQQGIHS